MQKTSQKPTKIDSKNSITFCSALKFEIELPNGNHSQIVTVFNGSEVYFEDLVKHTLTALAEKSNHKIKSVVTTLGNIQNGNFRDVINYDKVIL